MKTKEEILEGELIIPGTDFLQYDRDNILKAMSIYAAQEVAQILAELHSLKQTITESKLHDYFPKRDNMSFHDKTVFAIDKIAQEVEYLNDSTSEPLPDAYLAKGETCKWEHNREKPEVSVMFCQNSRVLLWSDARHFNYCPFCGRKIERV